MVQGYLSTLPEATVRVRVADGRGFITVKGRNSGACRSEWEYEVPEADALEMLRQCAQSNVLEKTRYVVPAPEPGLFWEVDVFEGSLKGLVLAEIELPSEDFAVELPGFVGREVTCDSRYYNSVLAGVPRS